MLLQAVTAAMSVIMALILTLSTLSVFLGLIPCKLLGLLLGHTPVFDELLVDLLLLACCALHQVFLTNAWPSRSTLRSSNGVGQVCRGEAAFWSIRRLIYLMARFLSVVKVNVLFRDVEVRDLLSFLGWCS